MVGRRKPPHLRVDNRASRTRGPSPEVRDPLGNCPPDLPAEVQAAWKMIARSAPPAVLSGSDRMAVQMASMLWAEMISRGSEFPTSRLGILQKLLVQFGLTPVGRLGLALPLVELPKEPNPFDEFH